MRITFQGKQYKAVFTEHAKTQMALRGLNESLIMKVIETGTIMKKNTKNKFWVFKSVMGRKDNMISVALAIEHPHLIVITAMVNWRPK